MLYIPKLKELRSHENGRFCKGNIPHNKGKRRDEWMTDKGKEKHNKTLFKKGGLPPNTEFDGAIKLRNYGGKDKYYFIRLKKSKWVLYHRYLWEQTNGEIPKGMLIVFKDRDSTNCTIENLECISMKENLIRNRNRKKAAESMRKTWAIEKMRNDYGLERKTKLQIK